MLPDDSIPQPDMQAMLRAARTKPGFPTVEDLLNIHPDPRARIRVWSLRSTPGLQAALAGLPIYKTVGEGFGNMLREVYPMYLVEATRVMLLLGLYPEGTNHNANDVAFGIPGAVGLEQARLPEALAHWARSHWGDPFRHATDGITTMLSWKW